MSSVSGAERPYEKRGTHLFRTHEVREALSAFWHDILNDLAQVSRDEVNVVRVRLIGVAAHRAWMRLCQERRFAK